MGIEIRKTFESQRCPRIYLNVFREEKKHPSFWTAISLERAGMKINYLCFCSRHEGSTLI